MTPRAPGGTIASFSCRPSSVNAGVLTALEVCVAVTHRLWERVRQDSASLQAENSANLVPIDLVTTSASGLDPDISPAAAEFQVPRVARERGMGEEQVRRLILKHTKKRQLGFLGEPRVNLLELNLDLNLIRSKQTVAP